MSSQVKTLIAGVLTLVLAGAGCSVQKAATTVGPNVANTPMSDPCHPSVEGERVLDAENGYFNSRYGFCFTYPSDVFTLDTTDGTTLLLSRYFVEENFKDTHGGAYRHYFSVRFVPIDTTDVPTKPRVGIPGELVYLTTTTQRTAEPTDATPVSIDGKNGYMFSRGIEGASTDYYVLTLNDHTSLIVEETYFTDFLKDSVKPKPFSEASEREAFKKVLSSIHFFTP